MGYRVFDYELRKKFEADLKAEKSLSEISRSLGVNKKTLYRELRRSGGIREAYSAELADENARKRRPGGLSLFHEFRQKLYEINEKLDILFDIIKQNYDKNNKL